MFYKCISPQPTPSHPKSPKKPSFSINSISVHKSIWKSIVWFKVVFHPADVHFLNINLLHSEKTFKFGGFFIACCADLTKYGKKVESDTFLLPFVTSKKLVWADLHPPRMRTALLYCITTFIDSLLVFGFGGRSAMFTFFFFSCPELCYVVLQPWQYFSVSVCSPAAVIIITASALLRVLALDTVLPRCYCLVRHWRLPALALVCHCSGNHSLQTPAPQFSPVECLICCCCCCCFCCWNPQLYLQLTSLCGQSNILCPISPKSKHLMLSVVA